MKAGAKPPPPPRVTYHVPTPKAVGTPPLRPPYNIELGAPLAALKAKAKGDGKGDKGDGKSKKGRKWEEMEGDDLANVPASSSGPAVPKAKQGGGIGKVPCGTCGELWKWSLMHNEKKWLDDDTYEWVRTCWNCMAKILKVTPEEARAFVLSTGGYSERKKARVDEYRKAVENVQEFFEMALAVQEQEVTAKHKRVFEKIARQSLLKAFEDMRDIIRQCRRADELQAADMDLQRDLVESLSKETDPQKREDLVCRIDELNSKPEVFLGFATQPVSQTAKADLWHVSTYQDEFSSGVDSYFRFFFICQATHGNNPRCFTMYTSKGWKRKYDTLEWRKGQTYYCDCGAKYHAPWGCLVEFRIDGLLYYMKAPVPDARTLDMLAMKAEAKFYKPAMSAAELFNVLPSIPPQSSAFVVPVGGNEEVMKIDDPDFFDKELKVFAWSQILNMVS